MKRFAIRFNAPVVLSFALISLLVLVLDSATGGASTARLFCVYRAPLTDPLTYVRFFTHVLGHSGYSHPAIEYHRKQLRYTIAYSPT